MGALKMTKEQYIEMYVIVGCCMEVYNELGRGLAEHIYQCALEFELKEQSVVFEREKLLPTYYKVMCCLLSIKLISIVTMV